MSASADDYRSIERQKHEQALEQQAHSANLMTPEDVLTERAEMIDKLMESELDSGTVKALNNLVSRDFVLSYFEGKDLTTFEWQLESALLRLFAMHPPQGGVGGKARTYYYDDPKDALVPLRPQDREQLRSFKKGILSRVRRSKGGYQQDKIGETTSRVETINRKEEDDSKGRIRGFLGR